MGCRILEDKDGNACFYDSVTMTAFGPVVDIEELEEFYEWLKEDPRNYQSSELWDKFSQFKKETDQ